MQRKHLIIPAVIIVVNLLIIIFLVSCQSGVQELNGPNGLSEGGPETAHIVIQFEPGEIEVYEIHFTAPITGLQAVELSGVELETQESEWGTAVCSIAGVGCPADNCFCSDAFWSYENWDGNTWQGYQVGANDSEIHGGAAEGWRWGVMESQGLPPFPNIETMGNALDWLHAQQDPDTGGYDSESSSVEVLLAIGSSGINASDWKSTENAPNLLDYWQEKSRDYAALGIAEAGKLTSGLVAAGGCWSTAGTHPLDEYFSDPAKYSPHAGFHAWAVQGALSTNRAIPDSAVEHLKNLVMDDGGWEWNTGFGSDTNITSLIIQTLIAAGEAVDSALISNGLDFLKTAQNEDGGFTYDPVSEYGTDSDANSTAYIIQAIYAVGGDPGDGIWSIGDADPTSYLTSLQLPDGAFEWQKGMQANLVATTQSIVALSGATYPIHTAELVPCP